MTSRIKNTIGKYFCNGGSVTNYTATKFVLDRTRAFYAFDVLPMGKIRMSQSDKWKTNPNHKDPAKRKREIVHRYHQTQKALREQAKLMGYSLGNTLDCVFFIPMPESLSDKKKEMLNGTICKVKPDTDNCLGTIMDTFKKSDSDVWFVKGEKRWAYFGSILIYKTN